MTADVQNEERRRLAVLELSKAGRPPEEPPVCEDPAGAFLDIALTSEGFMAIVFIVDHRAKTGERAITDLAEAIRQRPTIEKAFQAGFEVVFGVRMPVSVLQARFAAWGYRELGRGRFGADDEHDPSSVPWNVTMDAFASAVEEAALHATTLCIFGHDWDPAYLLSADLAE